MIIPIRCYTCGKPIGHLWDEFQKETKKGTKAGTVMDKLGMDRFCCRSVFLTHKDLTQKVGRFKK
jgi:DNA-directed RNA polymerase subunit N